MKHSRLMQLLVGIVALLVLGGCGPTDNEEGGAGFSLTVGRDTITTSTTSRKIFEITTPAISTIMDLTSVYVTGDAVISLDGDDRKMFVLKNNKLYFDKIPDRWNPSDKDHDGIYKLDIKASNGDKTIVYKLAYEIPIPTTAQELLSGHTYYVDLGQNHFYKAAFSSNKIGVEEFIEYESNRTFTLDVTYDKDTFSYRMDGTGTSCRRINQSSLTFVCTTDDGEENTYTFRTRKPEPVFLDDWKLKALPEDINNSYTDGDTPVITEMVVAGNAEVEGGKAQIYSSRLEGKFYVSGTLENAITTEFALIALHGASSGVSKLTHLTDQVQTFNCTFIEKNSNGSIHYNCAGVDMNDTNTTADTRFYLIVCNNSNTNNSETKCNFASVPVLFIDE
jgi:hypothetical protein